MDTFFIYPTEYLGMNEGDSDYASLDNPDMVAGAKNDYMLIGGPFFAAQPKWHGKQGAA